MLPTQCRRAVYRSKGYYRVLRDEFAFTAGFTDHNFQTDTKRRRECQNAQLYTNVILEALSFSRAHAIENHLVWPIQRSKKKTAGQT
jgi:hypothetical protein